MQVLKICNKSEQESRRERESERRERREMSITKVLFKPE